MRALHYWAHGWLQIIVMLTLPLPVLGYIVLCFMLAPWFITIFILWFTPWRYVGDAFIWSISSDWELAFKQSSLYVGTGKW